MGSSSDFDRDWKQERKKLFLSMLVPFLVVSLMWLSKAVEYIFDVDFTSFGIYPGEVPGLIGIVTSPFVHADVDHLINNSMPLFLLGTALFYFYSKVAFRVLLWIVLLTGLTVWLFGRQSFHIGASGVIYGLFSFLFFSGIFRMHIPLVALSLLVVFLYGEMVWGIFPGLKMNISWESHMLGAVAGIFLAIWYRHEGPQAPVPFPNEDEEDTDEEEDAGDEIQPGTDKMIN